MPDFTIKQGDVLPVLNDTLTYSDGTSPNLAGASVNLVLRQMTASNYAFNKAATITNNTGPATVSYTFTATDTATAGQYVANWIVTFSGGTQMSFPTVGDIEITIEENLTTPGGARMVGLGDVREWLGIASTDRSRDARLIRLIDAYTKVVEGITGPILPKLYQNETYDGGDVAISTRQAPIVSVQSVTEYRGPIPYPLTQIATPDLGTIYSYMWDAFGRITRRTVGGGMTPFPPGQDAIFVTYTAGYITPPPNVVEGLKELIRVNWQETQQGRPRPGMSELDDETPRGPMLGFFVPGRVRELLAENKRIPSVA